MNSEKSKHVSESPGEEGVRNRVIQSAQESFSPVDFETKNFLSEKNRGLDDTGILVDAQVTKTIK